MGGYSAVATVVSNIAARFTTPAQLEKLKAFNNKHTGKFGSSISTLNSAVETVNFNLDWSDKKLGSIRTFLKEHGKNSAAMNNISILSLLVIVLIAKIL